MPLCGNIDALKRLNLSVASTSFRLMLLLPLTGPLHAMFSGKSAGFAQRQAGDKIFGDQNRSRRQLAFSLVKTTARVLQPFYQLCLNPSPESFSFRDNF